ncbi:MAG TPA: large conductance mechanosensitive channel protein MscL [Anaerolineaceae bacterium]|jgi:large conductance mechanosensitive channel|nr:large conductance mechanosensitive channel protein MscL [Anaerolineaceae bacterium]HNS63189.1 large conductance mechanosensitive channel protein MscL [Anaerolineaceae bacterium]HNZ01539.1 large conductance mechanosensitive channel protein MscL [Anaerolineaceae bacterium]HOD44360.1 large conductance mechanosensitive channel protein MscL [Anaerolineaceae bacterium]HOH20046.1 large conductance mechanosensitive channel protein MscL [Anaerolineaceae bacterium]
MLKEFKEFAMRGNLIDLAIGIVIGGAFGKIVTSFVNDVVMPPIGKLLGGVNFADLFIDLSGTNPASVQAAKDAGVPTLNYGAFLNTVIDFIIVAFVMFLVVKAINKMKKPAPAAAPTTKECPYCKTEIPLAATRCPHCTSQL